MIKKISAIFLALVLCLGVVVVPASALADGKEIEYRVELDADSYSAGDEVTVNLYVNVADGHEWGAMTFVMGVSDVFVEPGENEVGTIKDSVVANDLVMSFYKDPAGQSWAWQTNATVLNNIKAANTAEENAMYSDYLKFAFARSTAGDHPYANSQGTKNGLTSDEINAEDAPAISFKLTLRDDLEDGAEIKVGVTSGSITKYGFAAYYTSPGTATKTYKVTAAESEFVVGSAKIGEATAPSVLVPTTSQIRYQRNDDGSYAGKVDVRTRATIAKADWDVIFGGMSNADIVENKKITKVGFVYSKNSADTFDLDNAKAVAQGGNVTGYTDAPVEHIQATSSGYIFTCMVENIPDADIATDTMQAVAYMQVGDTWYFYDAVTSVAIKDLYNNTVENANNAYGWDLAKK